MPQGKMTEGEKSQTVKCISHPVSLREPPSRCSSVTLAFCRFPEAAFIPLMPLRYPQERAWQGGNRHTRIYNRPPKKGVSAVVTTIQQVNATGLLKVIYTGGTHYLVVPPNGTVIDWMNQGMDSIWSQVLSDVVVEWEG